MINIPNCIVTSSMCSTFVLYGLLNGLFILTVQSSGCTSASLASFYTVFFNKVSCQSSLALFKTFLAVVIFMDLKFLDIFSAFQKHLLFGQQILFSCIGQKFSKPGYLCINLMNFLINKFSFTREPNI